MSTSGMFEGGLVGLPWSLLVIIESKSPWCDCYEERKLCRSNTKHEGAAQMRCGRVACLLSWRF
jgi:hypothetical protein